MLKINKMPTGFRFGKYKLKVVKRCYSFSVDGRTYVGMKVETHEGIIYNAIRLYNSKGKFIKQFLFEECVEEEMIKLIKSLLNN